MQLRDVPVGDVMVTDVLTFRPDDDVLAAMRALVTRDVDGAPVVDADRRVVGMLSTADLIVEEARLPLPAVISLLGAVIELPASKRRFEKDLEKALGSSVGEVMADRHIVTIAPDDTVETAATLMHDHDLNRLPVVGADGRLAGLVARGDIIRAILRDLDGPGADPAGE